MDHAAEMIFTGDELLRGDAVNTNQAYLGQRLLDLGIFATHALCVADQLAAIVAAIQESLSRHPSVLVLSGGLGPTEDDLTREATAEALGRPLEHHEDLLELIRERFASRGFTMGESNRKQASLPQGASPIPISGTAPGFTIQHGDTLVVALPGGALGTQGDVGRDCGADASSPLRSGERSRGQAHTHVRYRRVDGGGDAFGAPLARRRCGDRDPSPVGRPHRGPSRSGDPGRDPEAGRPARAHLRDLGRPSVRPGQRRTAGDRRRTPSPVGTEGGGGGIVHGWSGGQAFHRRAGQQRLLRRRSRRLRQRCED